MSLTVGLGGVRRHGCAALSNGRRVLGVCEQERVTRTRGAGFNATGLPDQALELLLSRASESRAHISKYTIAEDGAQTGSVPVARLDHHYAHACAAYLTSPFSSATIVVCDREEPKVSVWKATNADVVAVEWPWVGEGFADLYSACARLVGFGSEAGDQRFEALARLSSFRPHEKLNGLFSTDGYRLVTQAGWQATVADLMAATEAKGDVSRAAGVAAALQGRIGELFLEFLAEVQRSSAADCLCLGGSFFYHSSINSLARGSGLFSSVFIPVDPGNAGLAVGTALQSNGSAPQRLSPFLGPRYEPDEIKRTLDNCKLSYRWVDEHEAVAVAVDALEEGRLVGWFEGAMEWGPRALGGRSILANPFAPFVLENLNQFLKRREPWRGYALSALEGVVDTHFSGPREAPFMECDYRPRDRSTFKHVIPSADAGIRVQTVDQGAPTGFRELLKAFGKTTGIPCVVNTSFNGFHEPIVCTPRDAVRVFYGSGLDMLVLDRFVLVK